MTLRAPAQHRRATSIPEGERCGLLLFGEVFDPVGDRAERRGTSCSVRGAATVADASTPHVGQKASSRPDSIVNTSRS